MALTEMKVRKTSLPQGKNQVKLTDGEGMYLLINKHGKYWRLDYRFAGKRKTAALGPYPKVGIRSARDKRDVLKEMLALGQDPAIGKRKSDKDLFSVVANEWLEKHGKNLSVKHIKTIRFRLDHYIFPAIGEMTIKEVDAPTLLAMLERIECKGHIETAHRVKSICGQVFRYAIATGRASRDPAADLRGALIPRKVKHMATTLEPRKIGALIRAIREYDGYFPVMCALRMAPFVFVRPGELRKAEWSEFDFENNLWRIPAEKMKMKRLHLVPLPPQVVGILNELRPLTGSKRFLFPSIRSNERPISDNTLNAALRRMGITQDELVVHGFRAMASTLLHEQGWSTDVIEKQLAHVEGNSVKRAYNHALHLDARIEMMKSWADYLDGLANQ